MTKTNSSNKAPLISIHEIAKVLSRLDDIEQIKSFLEQLLTGPELEMIPRRWETVKLLYNNVPQREVASRLGMSLCKVTRGAKELNKETSMFKYILENYPELQ